MSVWHKIIAEVAESGAPSNVCSYILFLYRTLTVCMYIGHKLAADVNVGI